MDFGTEFDPGKTPFALNTVSTSWTRTTFRYKLVQFSFSSCISHIAFLSQLAPSSFHTSTAAPTKSCVGRCELPGKYAKCPPNCSYGMESFSICLHLWEVQLAPIHRCGSLASEWIKGARRSSASGIDQIACFFFILPVPECMRPWCGARHGKFSHNRLTAARATNNNQKQ